eukprot:CAMPEP_0203756446 /NCGR_PEP_ID=MMETSP0098-20131031/9741_1 /ASSEMBLY_ACC=CAM_ASM_000208 /TAXON_ID=96639 /ORGANISM=" , Strain NY0313808BC1" /LENGTH=260 /DNA_ID=CAMNT_0050648341 /DNA_START=98 /DNA_END=877 /DNA_ORIENTATION=-
MTRIAANLRKSPGLRKGYLVPFTKPVYQDDLPHMIPGTQVLILFNPQDRDGGYCPGNVLERVGPTSFRVSFYSAGFDMVREANELMLRGDDMYLDVAVPEVVEAYSTRKLLVMSFEDGIVSKNGHTTCTKEEIENQATMVSRAFTNQILIDCLAHGDPHPANVLYRPGKPPVLLDFGLCRSLDPKVVGGWCKVVYGASQLDLPTIFEGFEELGFKTISRLSPKTKREQMLDLCRTLFPHRLGNDASGAVNFDDLDRESVL